MTPEEKIFRAYVAQELDDRFDCLVPEYRFNNERRWRFDYAWPDAGIALEVEGGVWSRGRHTRGAGFLKDCEKYNDAAVRGWIVIRVTPDTLCTPETIALLKRAMERRFAA